MNAHTLFRLGRVKITIHKDMMEKCVGQRIVKEFQLYAFGSAFSRRPGCPHRRTPYQPLGKTPLTQPVFSPIRQKPGPSPTGSKDFDPFLINSRMEWPCTCTYCRTFAEFRQRPAPLETARHRSEKTIQPAPTRCNGKGGYVPPNPDHRQEQSLQPLRGNCFFGVSGALSGNIGLPKDPALDHFQSF